MMHDSQHMDSSGDDARAMDDASLDRLIIGERLSLGDTSAPVDAMWMDIEQRTSLGARTVVGRRWMTWVGMAATLVLGFALGRIPFGPGARTVAGSPVAAVAARAVIVAQPYEHTTADLLGETAVLLAALPSGGESAEVANDRRLARDAAQLLVTTRLLLDSQASSDPRLRTLLEDLELVLAQIARMRASDNTNDIELITEALHERELVPRIRTYAAQLAASAD